MSKRKTKLTKAKHTSAKKGKSVAAVEPVVTTLAPVKLSGINAGQREERNGVKRPKDGGRCAEAWQALDAMLAGGIDPSTKDVRELSIAKGWNLANSLCELSAWRKFNGISRSVLRAPKSATKAPPPAARVEGKMGHHAA